MTTDEWTKFAKIYDPIKIGSIDGTDTDPHDKAVVRAINSEYRPNKFVKGRPEHTIFVSNINPKTTKNVVRDYFAKYGEIKRFRLVRDIVTGFSKGYAFVEYEKESYAEEAYRTAYKTELDGRNLFVDFECERLLAGWKPRRLGGGFGGKRESGQIRFGCRDRPFKKPIQLELKERKNQERRTFRRSESGSRRSNWHEEPRGRHRSRDEENGH